MIETFGADEVSADDLDEVRRLCDLAFDGTFDDDDWAHSLGGHHVIARRGTVIVGHAAVVPRRLDIDGALLNVGYVEAVAVLPAAHGTGLGSEVMTQVGATIERHFDLGALSTGAHHFYERVGWERWQGPTFTARSDATIRTADEDDGIMVLRVGRGVGVALTSALTCDERAGDDW